MPLPPLERYVLGTAHLMSSFKDPAGGGLRQALAAYHQAEKLGLRIPDLFYNRCGEAA